MKSLNDTKFIGFPDLPWQSIFQRYLIELEYGLKYSIQDIVIMLVKIFVLLFFPRDKYEYNNNKSKILFFISYVERKTVNDFFLRIRKLIESDLLNTSHGFNKFAFKEGLMLFIKYVPSWFFSINQSDFKFAEKLYIVKCLIALYRLQYKLNQIDADSYNLVVTYNDSLYSESLVVEYFRQHNVKSASLQHGQFVSWRENTFINCGIEFKTFKSDYLLCWNKYTYDEAINFGIAPSKLKIVGIWTYINTKRVCCKRNNNQIFGVVIGHPSWQRENEFLIKAANYISDKYHLGYYVKLHPFYAEDAFSRIVNSYYEGNIQKGIDILDYANKVDFSLVGSSSVFAELVYIEHDVLRYSSGEADDKYQTIKKGLYFKDFEQLDFVFKSRQERNHSSELFDYLCTVSDVTQKYKDFFSNFD